jgi:pimeloyl-ACP methyl ester carboxylesterase
MLDDRTEELRKLRVPALVMHGMDDPLIPPRAGRATAKAIKGSKLVEFPGMGHDLPPALWPQLVEEIADHAALSAPRTSATVTPGASSSTAPTVAGSQSSPSAA